MIGNAPCMHVDGEFCEKCYPPKVRDVLKNSISPEVFNIPCDLKHDHSIEALKKLEDGIELIKQFDFINHDGCLHHVIKYTELNIRFMFLSRLIDKESQKKAYDVFIKNLNVLFNKE